VGEGNGVRFGRVEGTVTPISTAGELSLHLVVWLDTGRHVETVRDEVLPPLRQVENFADLVWHADQWTQETIGTILSELGWEAIGAGEVPSDERGSSLVPRSAAYAVRNLTW
jgi:hypothetical protein